MADMAFIYAYVRTDLDFRRFRPVRQKYFRNY